jgi:hypothetical protein
LTNANAPAIQMILSIALAGNAVPKFNPRHLIKGRKAETPSTFYLGIYSVELVERGEDIQNE